MNSENGFHSNGKYITLSATTGNIKDILASESARMGIECHVRKDNKIISATFHRLLLILDDKRTWKFQSCISKSTAKLLFSNLSFPNS